ncbi:GntR family transcriptional regulator [Sphingomonas sp. SUN039]|uniref:GntR family transcriptional regulator n=1 Tax=Sphingomonas sp. SUN039 TaxID=2937787 RepID=UPI00216409D5|nr:GntR family transcriptional regulator [Sphingomonas sp. SUN039]UVO53766.1 GntR family transcriptional regulator [Sphingomonas sp. SUN039]
MIDVHQIDRIDDQPKSQASWVYTTVRGDIIAGRHSPGQKLKIQELASELKVSPGAVREALSRLVPEQLVVSRDQRGFVVAPLSINDLEDLTDVRCEIETIALRRSVERGDVAWEANLVAAAHRLTVTPSPATPQETGAADWLKIHAAFHASLVSGCESPRLIALHNQLYEQSERYRILSSYVGPRRNVPGEHQRIVKLALARDADGLIEAAVGHIRQTTDLIVRAALEQKIIGK